MKMGLGVGLGRHRIDIIPQEESTFICIAKRRVDILPFLGKSFRDHNK